MIALLAFMLLCGVGFIIVVFENTTQFRDDETEEKVFLDVINIIKSDT